MKFGLFSEKNLKSYHWFNGKKNYFFYRFYKNVQISRSDFSIIVVNCPFYHRKPQVLFFLGLWKSDNGHFRSCWKKQRKPNFFHLNQFFWIRTLFIKKDLNVFMKSLKKTRKRWNLLIPLISTADWIETIIDPYDYHT